ncbi:hypothetical protein VV02_13975 [Luteipulveratus mongoliensis]|uniref:Antitoxin FitA-like ribbon-helix-helix domain-containing protein n=1 Tax=Luteipulveratus mongoliensis TaxID=571913 RepID=A0A0K1JQC2_9MICO|nr:hypothetical protein VV02_13975 [Luteipulveratus mongoliensis]
MATITVRGLDDAVRDKLRVRAAEHGRSMEAEVRQILNDELADRPDDRATLGDLARRLRRETGGVELPIPPRTEEAGFVDFSDHL